MSVKNLTLVIDIPKRRLIRDFFSNVEIQQLSLVQGDALNVRVIAVEAMPFGNPSRLWRYIELPTSVHVGIGTPGARATSGTFTLTYGANTTTALSYAATAGQVQTALNLLASVIAAGGVTVSAETNGGPYQVAFVTAGTRTAISGNADALYPLSTLTVYTARDGTVDLTEIQLITVDRQPAALADDFTAIASPTVTVTTVQGGASGVPEIQKVALSADTHDGTFTLTFSGQTTAALAWNISSTDLATALAALSNILPADIVVAGQFPEWTVTFQGALTGNQTQMTGTSTGLIGPQGVEGILELSTAGIEQLVNGTTSVETFLEVSVQIDGSPVTILQSSVVVKNDQIPNAPATGSGMPVYYTVAEVDAGFVPQGTTTITDLSAALAADASTSHALNATFSDTEAETALNALGTKLNAAITKLNTTTTTVNSLLAELRTLNVLGT